MSNKPCAVRVKLADGPQPFPSDEQLSVFMIYLSYRCQKALFQICKECEKQIPWSDFVLMLWQVPSMRTAARAVLRYAIKNASEFHFPAPGEPVGFQEYDDTTLLRIAQFYPRRRAIALMRSLLHKAKQAQYRHIRLSRPSYSRSLYLNELQKDESLRRQLLALVMDWMDRIDFESLWTSEDIRQTAFLRE